VIRIDLKKDELAKETQAKKGMSLLEQLKLDVYYDKYLRGLNPNVILIVVVAAGIAYLPSFILNRYREGVQEQYQEQFAELNEALRLAQTQITKLSVYRTELKSYEDQKRTVEKRIGVVRQLLSLRGTPVYVLDAVGQHLKRRTWLDDIKFEINDGDVKVTLKGSSFSNEEISDYVDVLSQSVYFSEVKLINVGTGRFEGKVDIKTFSIEAKATTFHRALSSDDSGI